MESTAFIPGSQQRYFDPARRSVRLAREFAAATLGVWKATDRADDVKLCVSELASNALAHGTRRGHGFLVRLAADDEFVRVEVHDSRDRKDDSRPRRCHPSGTDVRGRGLLILDALADDWGVDDREPFGKVVWALFKAQPAGFTGTQKW